METCQALEILDQCTKYSKDRVAMHTIREALVEGQKKADNKQSTAIAQIAEEIELSLSENESEGITVVSFALVRVWLRQLRAL